MRHSSIDPAARRSASPAHRPCAAATLTLLLIASVARAAAAPPYQLVTTLLNPSPGGGDRFGSALAAAGTRGAVGAPNDDTRGTDAGAVQLFVASTGGFALTLFAPAPASGDRFGAAVAMTADRVFVGAPGADGSGSDAGAVYVFDAASGGFLLTLSNPSPSPGDHFGAALAVRGDLLVVGAPDDDQGATDAGAVHLLDGTSGTLERSLFDPSPAPGDHFGAALATVGDLVVIGAPDDDAGATNAGAVHLVDAATGQLVRTVPNPAPGPDDRFGAAIAVVGGSLLVGAPLDDAGAADAGVVQQISAATGLLARTILNPSPQSGDHFGAALVGIPGAFVAGAPEDDTSATDTGAAYVFDAATGLLTQTLLNPSPQPGDRFGGALAALGGAVVAAAPQDDAGGTDTGVAHLFDACGTGLATGREQCDDGNRLSGDGCAADCTREAATPTPSPTASATPTIAATATGVVPTSTPAGPTATGAAPAPTPGGAGLAAVTVVDCRAALASAARALAMGEHTRLQRCVDRTLAAGTSARARARADAACRRALVSDDPPSASARARSRAQALVRDRCAGVDPGAIAACAAPDVTAVACVLDRHTALARLLIAQENRFGEAVLLSIGLRVVPSELSAAAPESAPAISETGAARRCRSALASAARTLADATHRALQSCLDRAARRGEPASDCRANVDPSAAASPIARLRSRALARLTARCAGVSLGAQCAPDANTVGEVIACVLDGAWRGADAMITTIYGTDVVP